MTAFPVSRFRPAVGIASDRRPRIVPLVQKPCIENLLGSSAVDLKFPIGSCGKVRIGIQIQNRTRNIYLLVLL